MTQGGIHAALVVGVLFGSIVAAVEKPPVPATAAKTAPAVPAAATETLKPDLVVVSIDFKDFKTYPGANGSTSASVIPSFTYKNQGKMGTGNFQVAWEYWDYNTHAWMPYLGQSFTNRLAAGQSWTEGGQPADACNFTIGHDWPRFRVRLDTANTVAESREDNNTLEKTFRPMVAVPPPALPRVKQ